MTTKNQESLEDKSQTSKTRTRSKTEKTNADISPIQQENSAKNNFKNDKIELHTRAQKFMSEQSDKFSTVARALMFGIIGTVWIIAYTEAGLSISNRWLIAALILSLLYFLVDVIHYFWNAMSYQDVSKQAKKCNDDEALDDQYDRMKAINGRSVTCVVIKFVVLILAATAFCIGLYTKMV